MSDNPPMSRQFFNPGVRVTVIGEGPRYRVATRSWSVQIEEIAGEPGRFHAFSETRKTCPECRAKFNRKSAVECPRCHLPLEPVAYLADVVCNAGRGRCTCESYTCNLRDITGPDEIAADKHLAAAFVLFGHFAAVKQANEENDKLNHTAPTTT